MKLITFIWIPKCAGTTINKYFNLDHQVGNGCFEYNFNNKRSVTFGHADINIIKKKKIMSNIFYQNSFKFCVVRNPYDRVVSLFHYLKLNKKYSFDNWVKYLYENKKNIPKNNHRNIVYNGLINNQWNLMSSWIPNTIDKIYFFEDGLINIINDINANIGHDENILSVPTINKSNHKHYKDYYKNKTTKEYVYEIYKEDFIRFNYSENI